MSNNPFSELVPKLNVGKLFIVSGPTASGKTTLVDMLHREFPYCIKNVSYTTRVQRIGEVDGKDYYFISKEQFLKKINDGDFLEHTELFGNRYGLSKSYVHQMLQEGNHLFLVVDVEGAKFLREKVDATTIFIMPPTNMLLKERLEKRSSENESAREERLLRAEQEMKFADQYQYTVVNDQLNIAYQVFKSIVVATLHKN